METDVSRSLTLSLASRTLLMKRGMKMVANRKNTVMEVRLKGKSDRA